jgi:hypothetical protein
MARRLHSLYRWSGRPGESALQLIGEISDARLRAWEYRATQDRPWAFVEGEVRDLVRQWRTMRPDLRIAETLWVGDRERLVDGASGPAVEADRPFTRADPLRRR